jgi:hypothetical protein
MQEACSLQGWLLQVTLRKKQNLGNWIQRNGVASATTNIVLSARNSHESFKNNWISDNGESCHYCQINEGLFDQATIFEMMTVGDGKKWRLKRLKKIRCLLQFDGRKFEITLENVKFVPNLWINLFSFNKALMYGFKLRYEGVLINLTKVETKLVFDQCLNTKGIFVSGIKMVPFFIQGANNNTEKNDQEYVSWDQQSTKDPRALRKL